MQNGSALLGMAERLRSQITLLLDRTGDIDSQIAALDAERAPLLEELEEKRWALRGIEAAMTEITPAPAHRIGSDSAAHQPQQPEAGDAVPASVDIPSSLEVARSTEAPNAEDAASGACEQPASIRDQIRQVIATDTDRVWTVEDILGHLPHMAKKTAHNSLSDLVVLREVERLTKGKYLATFRLQTDHRITQADETPQTLAAGENGSTTRSKQRVAIIDTMRGQPARWWRAAEVARAAGLEVSYVRTLLGRMVGYGEVAKDLGGAYQLLPHMLQPTRRSHE